MEPRMQVFTLKQTAKVLQFSESKTRKLLDDGVIPTGIKIAGTWRVHGPSLYSWISGQATWPKQSAEAADSGADRTSR